ncbi:5-oxoprolinase subunit PxpB [Adhaeribacter rhizoryzae]|uniref:5-oxoprolinase subunit PxpB n=1 Tax=Adhaeribacter rhizoryzae TaxID=2607907 RepID=A0A5M6D7E5_9BACT|nr:5-oxoprolinase subunit PxpB [Adhaeribacter rhizoryzae]KAA5543451.1 5-oxoprolinase subunit PxpB [Adhaeribacter rhizoryzae]
MENALPPLQISPLGDAAIIVKFGENISPATHTWVKAFAKLLTTYSFPGFVELVPAYTTVTIFYNPWVSSEKGKYNPYEQVTNAILNLLPQLKPAAETSSPIVKIPVCYGGNFGPDLAFVALHNNISPEEVIHIHTRNIYLVYMIGFAPGFPYLGGMDASIAAPRKKVPLTEIPAGSVGIGGLQTGIYSLPTPGGWQLIGRTPLNLFNPGQQPATLLQAGDRVQFFSVTPAEFNQRKARENES